eukprot:TRINITY_DN67139_c0_g1_i1.p1 TRINITY_DN67139_c0_g1~~TRINITY_DN67139_c0_g1_i1.p1  ORF type:complete len:320 (-),score=22.74 TRINITY_DN67139_c0_g1_i1:146-1072(-)
MASPAMLQRWSISSTINVAIFYAMSVSATVASRGVNTRVAFVGNSYTYFNDMPAMLANLSKSAKRPIEFACATPGGSSLFDHANVSSEIGRQTQALLQDPRGWDFVVLQDKSQVPGGGIDSNEHLGPGLGKQRSLDALRSFFGPAVEAANATAILYSTWGRRNGDSVNAECCGYGSFFSMNAKVSEGYQDYARTLANVVSRRPLVAPCGEAFELAYNLTRDPFSSSSLFSCLYHHWTFGRSCVLDDAGHGGHPSVVGSYLISCVLFAVIHGRSPVGVEWSPLGITSWERDSLQHIAASALGLPLVEFV